MRTVITVGIFALIVFAILSGMLVVRTRFLLSRELSQTRLELNKTNQSFSKLTRPINKPSHSDTYLDTSSPKVAEMYRRVQKLEEDISRSNAVTEEMRRRLERFDDKAGESERAIAALQHQVNHLTPQRLPANPNINDQTKFQPQEKSSLSSSSMSNGEPKRAQNDLLQTLVSVYNNCRGNDKFVSIAQIVQNIIRIGVTSSEEEATKMINSLWRTYPEVVRIEEVRGKQGLYLAIYES